MFVLVYNYEMVVVGLNVNGKLRFEFIQKFFDDGCLSLSIYSEEESEKLMAENKHLQKYSLLAFQEVFRK